MTVVASIVSMVSSQVMKIGAGIVSMMSKQVAAILMLQ